jgi:glutathione synthase/RimK-type ligase-like ATP-grasp enzyme
VVLIRSVTVVGERMFAAAILPAPDGYDLDYRMDMDGASIESAKLPVETQRGIHALMKRLGLVFGAVDLRRTPDDRYVFLELNPAGEWRFVEERTNQPITYAVAELLAELDQR